MPVAAFSYSRLRPFSPLTVRSVFSLFLFAFCGCDTDAVGVEACRQIESARCLGAEPCGFGDVEACQRFARDNCLHGMAGEQPGDAVVRTCTDAIEAAAHCADRFGAETKGNDCRDDSLERAGAADVCTLISEPHRLAQCDFLRRSDDSTADPTVDAAPDNASSADDPDSGLAQADNEDAAVGATDSTADEPGPDASAATDASL